VNRLTLIEACSVVLRLLLSHLGDACCMNEASVVKATLVVIFTTWTLSVQIVETTA